ncbi:hypothetical protein EG329_005268 [Mollisiaceae sp. DMI_Dod_QoI]|nr:hypothetical protein EG329_005268 [Helotiales sp. DMI_Dod_QoI]
MQSSILLFVAALGISALPSPQTSGTVALGGECSSSSDCANGADCYAVNSMLIPRCGNFQASCSTDLQCAHNTCVGGFCSGFLSSTATSTAPQATGTVGLGGQCSTSADCANGADCYAVNSMLIPACGNFQASCTSDSQCAFNTCNNGFCNGFIATTIATTTSAVQTTPTSTTVYLPLGADCSPDSTPCGNGADCYASNSMLQPRCGNFAASCSTDAQCAFNACNTNTGLCTGFLSSSMMTVVSAPTPSAY